LVENSPDSETMAGPEEKIDELKVVRDRTFSRCVADRGIVLDLGRDMEIAFLQAGPNLVVLRDLGETEGLALDPVLTETSRVRFPWPSAMDLAMNIIREGISKGTVNVPLVIDSIKSYPQASTENEQSDG